MYQAIALHPSRWRRLNGLRRRRCRYSVRRRVLPRRDERYARQVCDLAASCVGHIDPGMVEQQSRGAVEFDARFLIRCLGRNQIRFTGSQRCRILQDCGLRGQADFQFLLIGVQRLARQVHGGLRRLHCDSILLHIKLRVADFNPHLIFQLMLTHLRLPVFQFTANLVRLRKAVAQRDGQRQPNALVGRGRVHELVQGAAIAYRSTIDERWWRIRWD